MTLDSGSPEEQRDHLELINSLKHLMSDERATDMCKFKAPYLRTEMRCLPSYQGDMRKD